MNRFHIAKTIAIGAALAVPLFVARAADDLPKAETILDKYVEVTGGKAAYEKHHTEISKGSLTISAIGLKGDVTSFRAEPDKSLMEVNLTGMGKSTEGTDGKVFWSTSAMVGPHVKEGAEKAQAQLSSRFNAELNWRDLFKDVKTAGIDSVDGKDCYKLQLTPADGSPVNQCYDKESGLLVKMTVTAHTPMGDQTVDSFVSDYRKEGDVVIPHKVRQVIGGQEIVINIDSVTFNAEIPADKFMVPDDIKALLKK